MATTRLTDVVVPEIFSPYVQQETEVKSRLIQSGAIARDSRLDADLAGGGATFNQPSFRDLADDEENVSSDDPNSMADPYNIGTATEIQVRLSRNNAWSSMDLSADLAGADPMSAIGSRVAQYWQRRLQSAFIATVNGVFAQNATATDANHEQNDMQLNVSGASFEDGVTNFTTDAFMDAAVTMGDSMDNLRLVMVHSIVYNRMLKNNLIDFQPDSANPLAERIPTFLGRAVIVDDRMPANSGVFDTWLFGTGAFSLGMGAARVPTEVEREARAGDGGGQETLHNRVEWAIHPVGYAFTGAAGGGGPSNATAAGNLAHADSWARAFTERKQIQMARLVTREF